MLTTAQVYVEAAIATAIMVTLGIITGFITAGVTGDRMFSFGAGFIMLAVSGALLAIRLWHMARGRELTKQLLAGIRKSRGHLMAAANSGHSEA